jgi:glycosyltransferase involved in cell wall biosynthesis
MSARIFVDTVPWFIRPNNTDWRYHFALRSIPQYVKGIDFYYPTGFAHAFGVNARYAVGAVRARLGFAGAPSHAARLDAAELARSGCNVVFNHGGYPSNAGGVPVLWQNSILDPAMQIAFGAPGTIEAEEIEAKRAGFERAAAIQVSTDAEKVRLSRYYPHIAENIFSIPFFGDYLRAVDPQEVAAKHRRETIRLLFVGREARRKGLDILLAAMKLLDWPRLKQCSATIVSACSDGEVALPDWPNLEYLRSASRARVIELMRDAHVFAMPSRFESYGLTFIEAMASGAVPLVPDWEVQREIVDDGQAGCIVKPAPEAVAAGIQGLLTQAAMRQKLALAGLGRFRDYFAPEPVARRYANAFAHCLARGKVGS